MADAYDLIYTLLYSSQMLARFVVGVIAQIYTHITK